MKNQESISKFQRAKNRVEKLRKFYSHLTVYLVINSIITGFKVYNNLDSWDAFTADLFSFSTLSSWIIWGLILLVHAFTVFILPSLLGYDWEERKIQQIMEEEKNAQKK
ncbi:hypothetical protein BTO05_04475 [Winogradskyella sp. PC-19]|uniref:2TM domain-containing protein n=1 Tax=unclassified Winogradskyella TaxID=2615021 RepID=UPI000B3BF474|nr:MULTISPECIES: 2TM domain-containing protein [unclassified Winogradskyella]ARV10721.1 hypothetical protein BTO05_04475 [Winogradskyella sp. PC-19]RZN76663.1 MAG: 2TM domain-containing protein [Winogradskyella sp.]